MINYLMGFLSNFFNPAVSFVAITDHQLLINYPESIVLQKLSTLLLTNIHT
jgi:hypothetical protein